MEWIDIANTKDIRRGKMKIVETEEKKLVVVNVDGKFYAINNRCPHMNAPLHLGAVQGKTIVCPLHGARYDVSSGKKLSDPKMDMPEEIMKKLPADFLKMYGKMGEIMSHIETLDLETYETKIEAGKIFVKLSSSETMFQPESAKPSKKLSEKYCWHCGTSIVEGVRFCDKCGRSQI